MNHHGKVSSQNLSVLIVQMLILSLTILAILRPEEESEGPANKYTSKTNNDSERIVTEVWRKDGRRYKRPMAFDWQEEPSRNHADNSHQKTLALAPCEMPKTKSALTLGSSLSILVMNTSIKYAQEDCYGKQKATPDDESSVQSRTPTCVALKYQSPLSYVEVIEERDTLLQDVLIGGQNHARKEASSLVIVSSLGPKALCAIQSVLNKLWLLG
ncbi:hypothetical protein STEG23_021705, partial [Scotinomys teguina]